MLKDFVFLVLFFLLLGAWILGWAVFHVAGGLIHILLAIAVNWVSLSLSPPQQVVR